LTNLSTGNTILTSTITGDTRGPGTVPSYRCILKNVQSQLLVLTNAQTHTRVVLLYKHFKAHNDGSEAEISGTGKLGSIGKE